MKEAKGPGGQKTEFANPIEILKLRLRKIINLNKEKKKLLDQYMRNSKIIEDAFDQIREATGISSIDEIVTTFIKADEQNHSLYNYVNVLNQECDSLEEQNKQCDKMIDKYERLALESMMSKEEKMKSLKDRADELEAELEISNKECDEVMDSFKVAQNHVQEMVSSFQGSRFTLAVAS